MDLGGNEIFMRPPKILVEVGVVQRGIAWTQNFSHKAEKGIDFSGARIARDADGTMWCDQSKYISPLPQRRWIRWS